MESVIKEVESKKTLGVLVDKHLCWDNQIDNINKKASKGIGMLRRVKPYVSTETIKHFYRALVQPHFDYCSMIWSNCMWRIFKRQATETPKPSCKSQELLLVTHMKYDP
jgi:hypothetical protein